MTQSRNLLWIADLGMTTPAGKAHWPTFLTLQLDERDAWRLHYSLSHHLKEHAMNPALKGDPITVLVGGGDLDRDEM